MMFCFDKRIDYGQLSLLDKFIKPIKSKFKIKKIIKKNTIINIELGAGDVRGKNGWLTIDVSKNCDIFLDLRRGLPFPEKSVSKIYSSHFLEHLTYDECQYILDESLRVLVKDGTFSVAVPNARIYLEAYVNNKVLDDNVFFAWRPAYNNTTRIDYVNFTAYLKGFHHYMFDEENLIHILKSKGFRNVETRGFDPELDAKERDFESIYALAIK